MKFAKLFELEDDIQVVVTTAYEPSVDCHCLREYSFIDNVNPLVVHEFINKESAEAAFNKYDEARARAFVQAMRLEITIATTKNQNIERTSFGKN